MDGQQLVALLILIGVIALVWKVLRGLLRLAVTVVVVLGIGYLLFQFVQTR